MRNRLVMIMSACLLTIVSCNEVILPEGAILQKPDVRISDVTGTSFVVSWDVVNDAGSYTYVFCSEEPVTIKERRIEFTDLLPDTEYTVSVKADAGYNGNYKDSDYVSAHIITECETTLAMPEPEVVAAYKSKTIISWKSVYGADAYEYTVDGRNGKVNGNSVELSGFEGSTEYTFRLRAVSSQPYVNPSEEAQVVFTTRPDTEDMPQIIIDYIESGPDYVNFNIYALPDCGYFYFAIPAAYFANHTENDVQEIYRDYIVEAILSAGYSLSTGVSTLSSYGSANYTEAPLYPEMSYYIVAFGLGTDGSVTTPMYKCPFKTLANDRSAGPDITGADWFRQRLFLSTFGGYNPSNCIWSKWNGSDVRDVTYLLTSTYSYNAYFDSSADLFKKYIIAMGTKVEDDETYEAINSEEGLTSRFTLSSSTSYTMGVVAVNEKGDSTFVVNTLATKASPNYYDWMFLDLGASDVYPTESALAASISISFDAAEALNLQVAEGQYYFCMSTELENVSTSQAGQFLKEKGIDFSPTQIKMLNMTGRISMSFGTDGQPLLPGTKYTLIASMKSVSGDEVVRFISSSTTGQSVDTKAACGIIPDGRIELRQTPVLTKFEFDVYEK